MTGDPRNRRFGRPGSDAVSTDPYATLGLPPGAALGEVKRAYRRLAKAFHPDSAGAAALPRFLAIHEAYERIATGRILPGAASSASAPGTSTSEPWRADPARARATRQRAASGGAPGRARPGRDTAEQGETAAPGGDTDRGRRRSSAGRRAATRKATLGSTTYDDAHERADASWSGASWYGPTTGEYWIINPREYADPRKHGPAYQARVREAAEEHSTEAVSARQSAADFAFDASSVAAGATKARSEPNAVNRPGRARRDAQPARMPNVPGQERSPFTGEIRPPDRARSEAQVVEAEEPGVRWPLLGGTADDPVRRLRLALVAWPPLGVAAAIAAGDVTGCAFAAASCTGIAPLTPWLAQVVIIALLMLLPPLARFLAFGTVAVMVALVPGTAFLLAVGAAGAPQAGFALGVLLALAWLAGVTYAAISAARRTSISSP